MQRTEIAAKRHHGQVVWFHSAKGYGFIRENETGRQFFVHYSGINSEGYRRLLTDQLVAFDVTNGEKGPMATNVRVIDTP